LSIDPFIACYFAEDRKIKYYIEKEGTDGEHIELDLPNYAIRPVVAENVLIKTLNLKLNHKLIFCHDKEGLLCENVSDLTQLIDTPILEVDVVKEKILMEMLGHVIQGLDYSQQAQELEVYEGYKIVKKTFDNGGL
jgi:hypothetical protein